MSELSPRYELNPYHDSLQKRAVDIAAGTLLSLPAGLALAVTIPVLKNRLDEGSVFFRQERVGGIITKLRTMRHAVQDEGHHSVWAASDSKDPRVVSDKIKNNRLDETPQVFQAIRDALTPGRRRHSIVCPRPLMEKHADDYYEKVREHHPAMAEFWRYELLPNVQHGALSLASVLHSGRTSNDGSHMDKLHGLTDPSQELRQYLFAESWIQCDVRYNNAASPMTDWLLISRAAEQLGRIMLG